MAEAFFNYDLETPFDNLVGIVVDNGSHSIKAGFSGDDGPNVVFNTVIGRSAQNPTETFVGDTAQEKRNVLSLKYPIDYGIVTNWNDMETIWDYLLEKELSVNCVEHPFLFTDTALNPKVQREKTVQLAFERYRTPGFYITNQSICSVYASVRNTGLIVECGEGFTYTHPIYQCHGISQGIRSMPIGGRNLTQQLASILQSYGYAFTTTAELECVNDVKESLCYVAMDYDTEIHQKSSRKTYELQGGQKLCLDVKDCIKCPEILFNPSLMGSKLSGIAGLIYDSIMACDIDLRDDLASSVALSGGSTLFENFPERLKRELQNLLPHKLATHCHIVALPERKYTTWIGGSILSCLSTFQRMWISKEEYEEIGPSVVHRKCAC